MGRRPVLGVKNALNQVAFRPREKGPLVRGCELPTLLASQEPFSLFSGLFFFFLPSLWEISIVIYIYIYIYISLSSVYPPPALASHPCLYLSARPIGYSFWHSVSCCGLHRAVQGSHPHQWDQSVSCGY